MSLVRLLGGDPETFRPMYRARRQMAQRRALVVQTRKNRRLGGSRASSFRTLCWFAALYGFFFLMLASFNLPLMGAGLALTLGCAFLLLIVVTEHFDVLVDPKEAAVLTAHPHDGRSFLLAKLAVIGRSLAILGAILFVPTSVVLGFRLRSYAAPFAFLGGAAGATVATCASGMLVAALILRLGGRKALERLMPWIQALFQVGYLLVIGSERLMQNLTSPKALETLRWAVPSFWFLAPVELVAGSPPAAALMRLLLAAAALALVLGGATRWLGNRLGERLLEPMVRSTPGAAPRRKSSRPPKGDRGRLLALLRVHLRSDWRTRSELLVTPLMLMVWLGISLRKADESTLPLSFVMIYAWLLLLSADTLTRSSRPETLWFILASPIDRTAFSLGTIPLLRTLLLAPAFAGMVWLETRTASSLPHRAAELLEMLALGDLMVLTGKGLFPDFPFSKPSHAEGQAGGQRTATLLVGGLIGLLLVGAIALFAYLGTRGVLAGAAVFGLLRFPVGIWARKRAALAVERLELTALATG